MLCCKMGREKIDIYYIKKHSNRLTTNNQRIKGLVKKLVDITFLCDVDASLISLGLHSVKQKASSYQIFPGDGVGRRPTQGDHDGDGGGERRPAQGDQYGDGSGGRRLASIEQIIHRF